MALPVASPISPMLAGPVSEIPREGGMLFEPKWDGYRCLVFVDPTAEDPVLLQSRTGKSFNRYFPEMLRVLPDLVDRPAVLDGELIVVTRDEHGDRLDWDALGERIHPASSRVKMLAERTPARFVAFDLLAVDEHDLQQTGFAERRGLLESLVSAEAEPVSGEPGIHRTPVTEDPDKAEKWFRVFEGAGLDGLIAKPADGHYRPGKRTMFKIKHTRTADCVVAGLRWHANTPPGEAVGSLLLGLYDSELVLHHVGVVGAFSAKTRRQLAESLRDEIDATDHPWLSADAEDGRRLPGAINRWRSAEQPWEPLPPQHVVEVAYDHTEGAHPARFRHTTQLQRWRPDRDPRSCGYEQLEEPARYNLRAVLKGEVTSTG